MPIKRKTNIAVQVLLSRVSGAKLNYHHVPGDILKNNKQPQKQQVMLWGLLRHLDELNFTKDFNVMEAVSLLKDLRLVQEDSDGSRFRMPTSSSSLKSMSRGITIVHVLHLFGGVEVLLRVLFHPMVRGLTSAKVRHSSDYQQNIRTYCIEVLHGVALTVDCVARQLGNMDELHEYLFSMMEDKKTFIPASVLLEDLLACNRKIVNLKKIGNLRFLVTSLRDTSFPGLCRILSVLVADLDFSEERSTLIAKDREEKDRSDEKTIADENQCLLLSYPELLHRMVKLASRPFPVGLISSPLLQSLQTLSTMPSLNQVDTGVGGDPRTETSFAAENSPIFASPSDNTSSLAMMSSSPSREFNFLEDVSLPIQVINEVMHKVEVLYVLTLFLSGKFKHEVQAKLGDLKLIPALGDIFDKLAWNSDSESFPRHGHQQSEDCDCTPESAVKIQFLRFVHSFCDHNARKHLLLSNKEIVEMKGLCEKYKLQRPALLDKAKSSRLRCRGEKGLLTKIVEVFKHTSPNNALRFWLSRAIEGFLRGTVSPPDQHFLINRGLVKHLVEHILDKDTKSKEIIQSSFDLLGELMKFNAVGFQKFNEAISSDAQFESFISIMTSNVVDSNMFIRCIVLSLEKFSSTDRLLELGNCRLCALVRKWEHKIYLMYKLITAISVDSLTQENVSCLNTSLIFFMFAYNHGVLGQYLQAFVLEEEAQHHPGLILANLRELLLFWRSHYLRRGKDCNQLEQSSSISFEHWQRVVDVMLNEDANKDTSITKYLSNRHRQSSCLRADFMSRDG